MRTVLPVFLCLALLLVGCGPTPAAPTGEQMTAPAVTTSPLSTEPPTAPPTEPPAEPIPGPTAEPVTEPASMFSGSVTAGGVVVHTDSSAYTPYEPVRPLWTRLREGPLTEFEASPDYGAVCPYLAARLFNDQNGVIYEQGGLYGFIDRSGRILTDGIYNEASILSRLDWTEGFGFHRRRYPFWHVTKVRVMGRHQGETPEESWTETEELEGLISLDGSRALPCRYSSVQGLGDGFIAYNSWETGDFEVYGPDFQLRFTGEELLAGEKPEWADIEGGDGLYLLQLSYEDAEDVCWFCDETGSRVLGPYRSAEPFREGLACVSSDGRRWGYIDRSGAWVIDPVYQEPRSFLDGRVVQSTPEYESILLDPSGAVLLQLETGMLGRSADGVFVSYSYRDSGEFYTYYDKNGSVLCSGADLRWVDAETWYEQSDDGLRLFRLGGAEQWVPEIDYAFRGSAIVDGVPAVGYICAGFESVHEYFVSEDLGRVMEIPHPPLTAYGEVIANQEIENYLGGEIWHQSWTGSDWLLWRDAETQLRLPGSVKSIEVWGSQILAVSDAACLCYDPTGRLLLRYPLDQGD